MSQHEEKPPIGEVKGQKHKRWGPVTFIADLAVNRAQNNKYQEWIKEAQKHVSHLEDLAGLLRHAINIDVDPAQEELHNYGMRDVATLRQSINELNHIIQEHKEAIQQKRDSEWWRQSGQKRYQNFRWAFGKIIGDFSLARHWNVGGGKVANDLQILRDRLNSSIQENGSFPDGFEGKKNSLIELREAGREVTAKMQALYEHPPTGTGGEVRDVEGTAAEEYKRSLDSIDNHLDTIIAGPLWKKKELALEETTIAQQAQLLDQEIARGIFPSPPGAGNNIVRIKNPEDLHFKVTRLIKNMHQQLREKEKRPAEVRTAPEHEINRHRNWIRTALYTLISAGVLAGGGELVRRARSDGNTSGGTSSTVQNPPITTSDQTSQIQSSSTQVSAAQDEQKQLDTFRDSMRKAQEKAKREREAAAAKEKAQKNKEK